MAKYHDYYAVMGVARDASADDIKRAYRRLARRYHPDVSKEQGAEERFKEVGEAYEVLKDPEKRAAYDALGSRWHSGEDFTPPPDWASPPPPHQRSAHRGHGAGPQAADFSDFFETLFGGAHARGPAHAVRGEDQQAVIELTLEEAYRGTTRLFELGVPEYGNDGRVRLSKKTLQVKIPAGVLPGQQIRLAGQGGPAHNAGPPGDLLLEVRVRPHPRYALENRDLYFTLPVSPWEAALGAKVIATTPGGDIELQVPAGAQSGHKLRLRGRGFPGQPPGDAYAALRIVNPPVPDEAARALFRELARALPFNPREEHTP